VQWREFRQIIGDLADVQANNLTPSYSFRWLELAGQQNGAG
jgi:hypothetical protein